MQKSSLSFLLLLFFFPLSLLATDVQRLRVGADELPQVLSLIRNKRVAMVINQTSRMSNGTFLADTLLACHADIRRIFAPEHGFRGDADAGEKIKDGKDVKTGVEVISLYGKNYKPLPEQVADVDAVIFDVQDVGARFYTYISTMHYVMEACAENGVEVIVLDRPNPNDAVDGPLLDLKYRSFVGMHPIPVLHGLTMAELALMINGEGWLQGGIRCNLEVVRVTGWKHGQPYSLPVKPSPNLPNDQAISLYPSLCFFESTEVSVGRGTTFPFQVVGFPDMRFGKFRFTPKSLPGFDKKPLQKDKLCYGVDLRNYKPKTAGIDLDLFIRFYRLSNQREAFFSSPAFMDKLAGSDVLRKQIIAGKSVAEIRQSWQQDLTAYKALRSKYLLYGE
jgi:uncharacterized protein YbbC (DUF1343 family)